MLPLFKVVTVVFKAVAKPFAGVIKKTSQKSSRFRTVFIKTGNTFHSWEIRINRKFLGLEGDVKVNDLSIFD